MFRAPSPRRLGIDACRSLLLVLLATCVLQRPAAAGTIVVPGDQPTLQAAVNAAASGDVILLMPGTHPGGVFVHDKVIVIASQFYFTGDTSYIAQTVVHGYGRYCNGRTNCRGDAVLEFGDDADGSAVVGLTVRDVAEGLYGPWGTKGVRSRSFVDIDYCHVIYTDDGTNYTGGSGGTISNSLFAHNHDDGIDLNNDVTVRVVNNIIRDNRDDGIEFRMNPYNGPATLVEFVGNRITGNGEDGIQLIDYPDSSHRIVRIERNYFANNAMAGLGCMANAETNQDFSGPQIPERVELVNNTFVGGDYHVSGGGNLVAINNIFTGASSYALWRAGTRSTAAYNLFWNNSRDAAGSNVDPTGNVHADPMLADDGTLTASSPAVDAGTASFQWRGQTILDLPPSAYEGAAPDLGASELGRSTAGLPLMIIGHVSLDELDWGSRNAEFEVRLTEATAETVTVSYGTFDGTARVADRDYAARSGILTIPPHTTVGWIRVPVYGDYLPEGDEDFTVRLSHAVNASILRGTGICTILNDDGVALSAESRVSAGRDDAEEGPGGSVSLSSSDLEMMIDNGSVQRAVGIRFTGLEVPQGATVVNAWVQFRSKETRSEPTSLVFRAEAADDAPPFVAVNGGLTSLPITTAQANWTDVPAWLAGQTTSSQRTPDLRSVIQEVVDRPGWSSGNALALIVTGAGRRVAYSYDGAASAAPLLHVEFMIGGPTNHPPSVSACADTSIPLDGAAFLHGVVSDDGLPVPPALELTWSQASGPGAVTFDDPHALPTRATFSAAGSYELELMASDGELAARDTVQVEVLEPDDVPIVIEARVAASADDAEESAAGSVSTSSGALEMMLEETEADRMELATAVHANGKVVYRLVDRVVERSPQRAVGMRFVNLAIPRGADIARAWVQFTAKEPCADGTTLGLRGQAIDHAQDFASANSFASRGVTGAEVPWTNIPGWTTVGEAGPDQRTPDLKALVQEIVNRPGWRSGNALALIVTGAGRRVAYSYDGGPARAPLLHVEFLTPETGVVNQAPIVYAGPDTVVAGTGPAFLHGVVTDDSLPAPPALELAWSQVSGPGVATFDSPHAAITRAVFSAAGSYRLELMASDGELAARDSVDVVVIDRPPVAALASFPVEGVAPFSVIADGTPSDDPDGDPLSYAFDFGDGTVVGPQAAPVAAHTYAAGRWVLTLTVAGGFGMTDTVAVPITAHLNLVANPSVEVDMTGWNANGFGASVARVEGGRGGSFCIEARGDSSLSSFGVNDSPNWVSTTAGPGARYHFSAWVRSANHSGRAHLKVREYLNGVLQGVARLSEYVDLEPHWQEVTLDVEATAAGSTLDFQILDKPRAPGEIFQVDDVSVWQIAGPAPALGTRWETPVVESRVDEAIAFAACIQPNPLGATATLALVTTRPGFARVRLYDSQGRLLRTLLDEAALPPGRHALRFETRTPRARLGAGVYFYSVHAAEGRLSGKLVVVE